VKHVKRKNVKIMLKIKGYEVCTST